MEELPKSFDFIILGTGLGSSLLSGALSRIGKTVLQLDKNQFYGSEYTSFTAKELDKMKDSLPKSIQNFKYSMSETDLKLNRINVNLDNNVLYSRGEMVNLLIQSKAYRYLEFRNIGSMLTSMNSKMIPVPASRSELFQSKHVTLLEKRKMMNFIQKVQLLLSEQPKPSDENVKDAPDSVNTNELELQKLFETFDTFDAYMDSNKLTEKLKYFISTSLCFSSPNVILSEGLDRLKRFMTSLGKYSSSSAFLLPQYGASELTQAFCRMSAVFGGITILDAKSVEIIYDSEHSNLIQKVKFDSNEYEFGHLIAEKEYLTQSGQGNEKFHQMTLVIPENEWSKCLDVDSKIEIIGDEEPVTKSDHYIISSAHDKSRLWGLCASSSSCLVPADHVMISIRSEDKEILTEFAKQFGDPILRIEFTVLDPSISTDINQSNLSIPPSQNYYPDYDYAVTWARRTFLKLCPEAEWLPAMPDPSDIILGE